VFWLVSEHGTNGAYIQNLIANPQVRVKIGRHWRTGTATVLTDDHALNRRRNIDNANGIIGRADGIIFRASASNPMTVQIDLHPATR
jgi:hypothetical protein